MKSKCDQENHNSNRMQFKYEHCGQIGLKEARNAQTAILALKTLHVHTEI